MLKVLPTNIGLGQKCLQAANTEYYYAMEQFAKVKKFCTTGAKVDKLFLSEIYGFSL
jgi:hypothetical protein